MNFVLDASVALHWFLAASPEPLALRVRDRLSAGERATVPALWHLEVANGLVVAERRKIASVTEIASLAARLDLLVARSIETVSDVSAIASIVAASRQHHLTAYDCAYLTVAKELGLPLATFDRALRTAGGKSGVALLS